MSVKHKVRLVYEAINRKGKVSIIRELEIYNGEDADEAALYFKLKHDLCEFGWC